MEIQNAKDFADTMMKGWSKKYVQSLNEGNDVIHRLEVIRDACERRTRKDIYGENALPQGYNPASYGLWWVMQSGRVNGETFAAIRAMKMRKLCELVYVLLDECGPTTEGYAQFLMERYTEKEREDTRMNQQKWTGRRAKDLKKGDLVPGSNFALEIKAIEEKDGKFLVTCYTDLHRLHTRIYDLSEDEGIIVALSGVKHGDFITDTELTEDTGREE